MVESLYKKEKHPWGKRPLLFVTKNRNLLKKGSLLDLGGGDGTDSLYLAKEGFKVTNVDIDPEAIKIFNQEAQKNNLKVEGVISNILDYQFDKKWDNIISAFTLHFLNIRNARSLIKKIKANTIKGGVNLIVGFTKKGGLYKPGRDRFYLDEDELLKLYKDWQILKYSKMIGGTRAGVQQDREMLIAKKH